MRMHCRRSGPEMAGFTSVLNLDTVNQMSNEKQELLRKFVEYLDHQSDKHKNHAQKMNGHGHCEKFGAFGRHGHGMRHGRYGPHGHRGQCGRFEKFDGFGRHGHGMHHGRYSHHGPHNQHGRHGLHKHHKGKRTHWTIDLTREESDDNTDRVIETGVDLSPSPQENGANDQEPGAEVNKECNCKCSRSSSGSHHRGRFGRWRLNPCKRSEVSRTDNSCQTDGNTEETRDNLTVMVENINIENAE